MVCPAFWRRACYSVAIILFALPMEIAAADEITDQLTLEMRVSKPLSRAEERALKPKDQFQECNHCPEMIVVPAGEFTMGSPEDEEGHTEDESPQHRVRFLKPFAVGRFAVTFDEWEAFTGAGIICRRTEAGAAAANPSSPSGGRTPSPT